MTRITSRTRSRDEDDADEKPEASAGYRGRAALDRYADEERKAKERRNTPLMPFRFRAEYGPDAQPCPIIILDKKIDNIFFLYEHSVQDDQGRWGKTEVCIKEHDVGCPLCQLEGGKNSKVGRSTYVMLLTVLDLRPYKNKDGKKIPYSRRIFAVKGSQIGDWMKIFDRAEQKFGTLRGLYLEVMRNDKQDASTGKPQLLDNDMLFDHVKEKELLADYGHDAVVGDNNKVIKKADEDITPFDYDAIFKRPTYDELARRYGVKSNRAGSAADVDDAEWERPSRRRVAEEDQEEAPRPSRSRRVTQADIPEAEEHEDDDAPPPPRRTRQEPVEEPEEEEAPARRTRSRPSIEKDEEPAPRTRRRVAEPEEEAEEEETPAPRRTRAAAPAAAPARKRKPEPEPEEAEEEEVEEAEEEAPRRVSARSRSREAEKPAARSRSRAAVSSTDDDDVF